MSSEMLSPRAVEAVAAGGIIPSMDLISVWITHRLGVPVPAADVHVHVMLVSELADFEATLAADVSVSSWSVQEGQA